MCVLSFYSALLLCTLNISKPSKLVRLQLNLYFFSPQDSNTSLLKQTKPTHLWSPPHIHCLSKQFLIKDIYLNNECVSLTKNYLKQCLLPEPHCNIDINANTATIKSNKKCKCRPAFCTKNVKLLYGSLYFFPW